MFLFQFIVNDFKLDEKLMAYNIMHIRDTAYNKKVYIFLHMKNRYKIRIYVELTTPGCRYLHIIYTHMDTWYR